MKVVFASLVASAAAKDFDGPNRALNWADFKTHFGKVYHDFESDVAHMASFESNIAFIKEQNAKGENLKFGTNQFTDLNHEEFKAAAGLGFIPDDGMSSSPMMAGQFYSKGDALASSVDWQRSGKVTPVKDQGQCGACWAFSTTGGLESAWAINNDVLVPMSEQQFVDCATAVNMGCGGGNVKFALDYASRTPAAVALESAYPYIAASSGSCQFAPDSTDYSKIAIPTGYVLGHSNAGEGFGLAPTVDDMKGALGFYPVSVAIEADQRSFQAYKSGILQSGCGESLDHAVLIVGYGTDGGVAYWRVKNSWGVEWGDSGYIRMGSATNVCGILNSQATFPVVRAAGVVV